MPNKTYAKEWLRFAGRNLETARLLNEARHYEDIIGIELQQAIEKTLKSLLAHDDIKIPKEHDLLKLYFLLESQLELDEDEIVMLRQATNYYKDDRYPNPNYNLPPRDEIEKILKFTEGLFARVCKILGIDPAEVQR